MNPSKNRSIDRIIIFTRYPVPGKTKTRLIPELGPTGTADLHRMFTEKTLKTVKEVLSDRPVRIEVRFKGGGKGQLRRWLGPVPLFSFQGPGDLGKCMHNAFLEAFQQGTRRVVLIGTDIPELKKEHLHRAFDALDENDIVLGPSTDGGYWLIGLKHPFDLFHGINWGTETVLDHTVALAKRLKLKIFMVESLTDIDTIEDLRSWRSCENWQDPYLSIIIPTLNEEANIKKTIHKARDKDAEIIVADGGSTDKTVERAIESGAQVVKGPPGRALQQNCGTLASRGKTLLFLHADTLLPDGYVNMIFETLIDPKVVLGGFRFKTDLDHPLMKAIEIMTNIRSRYLKMPYGDQGLFFRKSIFDAVGGFQDVPIAEDLFLVRRMAKLGIARIAPACVVTSARKWQQSGLLSTTLANIIIFAGCLLEISPQRLMTFYNRLLSSRLF